MMLSDTPEVGDRIELLEMPNDPAPIEKGSLGTVTGVPKSGDTVLQVQVDWDNGRRLALVPEADRWRIIDDSSSAARQYYIDTGIWPDKGSTYPV